MWHLFACGLAAECTILQFCLLTACRCAPTPLLALLATLATTALQVVSVFLDCDRDSLIYLSEPIGPACHTNAPTCYFRQADAGSGALRTAGEHSSRSHAPMTTLYALERTIAQRRAEAEAGTGARLNGCSEAHACMIASRGPEGEAGAAECMIQAPVLVLPPITVPICSQ